MMVFYFDMDGVIARWNPDATEADTHQDGYFLEREPEKGIIELMKLLRQKGFRVEILTAAYVDGTARQDKQNWLLANELAWVKLNFVPYGQSKANYVEKNAGSVLIDDYSHNLREWESSGMTGVKFYNGINGTHGSWKGSSIHRGMTAESMAWILRTAAKQNAMTA